MINKNCEIDQGYLHKYPPLSLYFPEMFQASLATRYLKKKKERNSVCFIHIQQIKAAHFYPI